MESYSKLLAEFVADFDAAAIPAEVLERSRQSILNGVAAGISASRGEPIEILLEVLGTKSGSSVLFGREERLDLLDAVMVNAYMAHYDDYDDTHRAAQYHTNPTTVPVVLALGADRHVDGCSALASLALGLEASIRLGISMGATHGPSGWHTTGTVGTVGAAMTAARLVGLDASRTNMALGLSLTQAAGLRGQMFGTMAKAFNAAKAAYNGLLGTLLAERGFTAADNAIEGGRAYASAASRDADLARLTDGLGARWETPFIGFKPYASGASTHAVIDAALALRAAIGLDADSSPAEVERAVRSITRVNFTAHEGAANLPRGRHIEEPLQAKFSTYNVAAVVLVRGRGGPAEYDEAVLTDPSIAYLRELIELTGDPAVANGSARVAADLADGRHLEIPIEHALGTFHRPLDDAALRNKLRDAASGILPAPQLDELAAAIERIDRLADVGAITALLATA